MLSPPRLPALVTSFHATARSSRSRATTGVVRSVRQGILHADPCTLCMHGYRPPMWGPERALMSEGVDVKTVQTFSDYLHVLPLGGDVVIRFSRSNRVAGCTNQPHHIRGSNLPEVSTVCDCISICSEHRIVFTRHSQPLDPTSKLPAVSG